MHSEEQLGPQSKAEARLKRRWPLLDWQDIADIALGQTSLLECLMRRYDSSKEVLQAEIVEFENMTPPPDLR
jgi:hypothetical protein